MGEAGSIAVGDEVNRSAFAIHRAGIGERRGNDGGAIAGKLLEEAEVSKLLVAVAAGRKILIALNAEDARWLVDDNARISSVAVVDVKVSARPIDCALIGDGTVDVCPAAVEIDNGAGSDVQG